jgi:hypothetical protein
VQRLEYESPQPKKPPFGSWKIVWGLVITVVIFLLFAAFTMWLGVTGMKNGHSSFMPD